MQSSSSDSSNDILNSISSLLRELTVFFGYSILDLVPSWSLVKCRHKYVISSLMDTTYWIVRISYETLTIRSNRSDKYALIVASEQRAELFDRIGIYKTQFFTLGSSNIVRQDKDGSFRMYIDCRELNKLTVCKQYLEKFMIVFIDDILIYFKSKKEHEEHSKLIVRLLKKEELYAKFSRCDFWPSKVQFISHVIHSEGIHVDPPKIESIKD
ncbi:hypothetical protein Tco_0930599 [Tanacetum coccineum]